MPIRVDPDIEEGTVVFARKCNKRNRMKKSRRASKAKARKPSMIDSFNSTILLLDINDNIKEKVLEFGKMQSKKKVGFNPIIVCIIDSNGIPTTSFVFIDHFYLKAESFKHAVDLFIQSFHVFDVWFPPEGAKVCMFLQEMFYSFG